MCLSPASVGTVKRKKSPKPTRYTRARNPAGSPPLGAGVSGACWAGGVALPALVRAARLAGRAFVFFFRGAMSCSSVQKAKIDLKARGILTKRNPRRLIVGAYSFFALFGVRFADGKQNFGRFSVFELDGLLRDQQRHAVAARKGPRVGLVERQQHRLYQFHDHVDEQAAFIVQV